MSDAASAAKPLLRESVYVIDARVDSNPYARLEHERRVSYNGRDCFASLAMTAQSRHCEEHGDEAIS